VLVGGLLDLLLARRPFRSALERERCFWGLVLAGALVLSCAVGQARNVKEGRYSRVERRAAASLTPSDRLYTDSRTSSVLEFFWGYPSSVATADVEGLASADVAGDVYVLVNRDRLAFLSDAYGYQLPEFYSSAPASWRRLWEVDRGTLYRVEGSRTVP
jgi:hypothetical protein